MTGLAQIFAELSISQYLDTFIDQGFDSWETILDITESDFDALGVKLGHRRKIQRRIADSRGISTERALASPTQHSLDDRVLSEEQKALRIKGDGKEQSGLSNGGKRKYRRHPKPDENAPDRPPSAYVIFSNKIREDLKNQQLSFTEIAKRVGENWQNLPPTEKEPYESEAFTAKDKYNNELAEYKKTDNYKNYQVYLAEFKAKQSSSQQATAEAESAKRPKLENRISNESSGNGSSTSSQAGDTPVTRKRRYSGTSTTSMPWLGGQASSAQSTSSSTAPTPKPFSRPTSMVSRTSPVIQGPVVLPGFRDSLAVGPLPLRETNRDTESNGSYQQSQHSPLLLSSMQPNIQVSRNRPNEQGGSFATLSGPAPLLTHESTVESASSGSSSVGPGFTPRTPLDLEPRGAPQYPSLFQSKVPGFFDSHQLPPLRPPSLSPQSSLNNPYLSPQGMATNMDYPGQTQAQHSLRNYQHLPSQNQLAAHMANSNDMNPNVTRPHGSASYENNDGDLDPVSALLRAGEIVDRNALNRQS